MWQQDAHPSRVLIDEILAAARVSTLVATLETGCGLRVSVPHRLVDREFDLGEETAFKVLLGVPSHVLQRQRRWRRDREVVAKWRGRWAGLGDLGIALADGVWWGGGERRVRLGVIPCYLSKGE